MLLEKDQTSFFYTKEVVDFKVLNYTVTHASSNTVTRVHPLIVTRDFRNWASWLDVSGYES